MATWVHAIICDNIYSDISMIIHSTLQPCKISEPIPASYHRTPHHKSVQWDNSDKRAIHVSFRKYNCNKRYAYFAG